jgi:hypothetical protein
LNETHTAQLKLYAISQIDFWQNNKANFTCYAVNAGDWGGGEFNVCSWWRVLLVATRQ